MEILGRILGLTATLISALILLYLVALAASAGMLDDLGRVFIGLLMIPVKIAEVLINLAGQVDLSNGGGTTTPTTGG